jgi:hypothetical protein
MKSYIKDVMKEDLLDGKKKQDYLMEEKEKLKELNEKIKKLNENKSI